MSVKYLSFDEAASRLVRDKVVITAFKKEFPEDAKERLGRLSEGTPPDDDESRLLEDVLAMIPESI